MTRVSLVAPYRTSPLVHIKEEPGSPACSPACSPEVEPVGEVGVCVPADTPLSPTTFINSILQDNEPTPTPTPAPASAPIELQGPKCLSVARLDK